MENSWSRLEPKKAQVILDRKEERSNRKLPEMFLAPFAESTQPSFSKKRGRFPPLTLILAVQVARIFQNTLFHLHLVGKHSLSPLAQETLGGGRQAFFILAWISCNSLYQAKNTVSNLLLGEKELLWSKCFKLKSSE